MTGSIGKIAEQILAEVKQGALTKIAQHDVVKEASQRPHRRTAVGQQLAKLAEDLRAASADVTVEDVRNFLEEAGHAN